MTPARQRRPLEIAGIRRRLDEVAGRVDAEEARRLTLDLAAERQRRIEVDAEVLESGRVASMQFA
jgi:hypothetical protein